MWLVFAEPLSEVHYGGGCLWSLCLHYHRQPNRYLSTNTLWEYHIYFTGTAIVIWKSRCSKSYPISVQFLKQKQNFRYHLFECLGIQVQVYKDGVVNLHHIFLYVLFIRDNLMKTAKNVFVLTILSFRF